MVSFVVCSPLASSCPVRPWTWYIASAYVSQCPDFFHSDCLYIVGVITSSKPNCGYCARRKATSLLKICAPFGWNKGEPGAYGEFVNSVNAVPASRWSAKLLPSSSSAGSVNSSAEAAPFLANFNCLALYCCWYLFWLFAFFADILLENDLHRHDSL